MKKTLVVTVILLVTVGLFGFEKGTKSLGGSISLGSYKNSSDSPAYNSFELAPVFGYFVTKDLCLDLSPFLGIGWEESSSTSVSLGIDVGFRYFFKNFYGGASYEYSKSGPKGGKYSEQSMALRLGFLLEIAKHIYLDNGIVFSHGLGNIKFPYYLYPPNQIVVSIKNERSSIVLRTGIQIFFK
jgi:hypothetical protein